MSAFVEWWRSTMVPLRSSFGFEVVFAAANAETGEFTWAVSHDGDFAAAEATYLESDARTEALAKAPTRTTAQYISMVDRLI
jgi:hypothetical protein